MRILHIIDSADPRAGGPGEAIRNLAYCHEAAGHVVNVLTLDAPAAPWLAKPPAVWFGLGDARGGYAFSSSFSKWLRTKAQNYDIIILNGLWKFPNIAVWWEFSKGHFLGRKKKIPYIIYPHGMLDPWFKHHYPDKHLKKAIYWGLFERHVIKGAAAVCFTCEEERRLARKTFWPYSCTEKVVGMGITGVPEDVESQLAAFREEFPSLAGQPFLLFLGRIHEKKGVNLLLHAYASAAKANASLPRLVVAGPAASPDYLQEMRALASKLGLSVGDGRTSGVNASAQVHFLPMLSGKVKWGAFRLAEVFILPSHQENFGIAVVEALACGVPVLISNKVNIWREIVEENAGLVDADTEAGTGQLLSRWQAMSLEEKACMRKAARTCFLQRFHIRTAASSLHRLIEEVVSSPF